jgi:uncharacterized membrane protein YqjE
MRMAAFGRSLADLASQAATLVATRLELFGLEALQARDRLLWRLAVLLMAAFLLMLALLVATLAFALSVWPAEYRTLALSLLALGYGVLGGLLLLWLRAQLRRDPEPFAVTADVLKADAQILGARVASAMPGPPETGSSSGSPDQAQPGGDPS